MLESHFFSGAAHPLETKALILWNAMVSEAVAMTEDLSAHKRSDYYAIIRSSCLHKTEVASQSIVLSL